MLYCVGNKLITSKLFKNEEFKKHMHNPFSNKYGDIHDCYRYSNRLSCDTSDKPKSYTFCSFIFGFAFDINSRHTWVGTNDV